MENLNKYIEDYLDYYCKKDNPSYAILLKGPWGSGKTWFIKDYLKKIEEKGQKKIYVSLYGIKSTSQIEDIFFQELHPLLASKGMALAGKAAKGLLKATFKIDLDGNSSSTDATINSQIPNIDLLEYLKNISDRILVFDDLERCLMNIEEVLGYINYFVEHQGIKVIIIANEEEILAKDEKIYKEIKEKLIGKTFTVESDFDSALQDIISEVLNTKLKKLLNKNKLSIKEIYKLSGYENLRHLKQSVSDFERFYSFIPADIAKKEPLVIELLKLFLVFSFEIKHGNIPPEGIKEIKSESIFESVENPDKTTNIFREINERYSTMRFYDIILTDETWIEFFDQGKIDSDTLKESLLNSVYCQNENTPNWIRLWHFRDLKDDEFSSILEDVVENYKNRNFKKVGEIKHVVGLLIFLEKVGLYHGKKKDIIDSFKKYIDSLKDGGLLVAEKQMVSSIHYDDYSGLPFWSIEDSEFKKLLEYVERKISESKIENLPKEAENLLKLMKEDTHGFYIKTSLGDFSEESYHRIPVLKYIDPNKFIKTFLELEPTEQRHAAAALNERYKYHDINEDLIDELSWIRKLIPLVKKEALSRKGKPSGYMLDSVLRNCLEKMGKSLQEKKKQLAQKE